VSKYQPFGDTNHRTAHTIVHAFLRDNGYPELAPDNDLELADILAKDRDPYRGLETQVRELTELFKRRMKEAGMERLVITPDTDTTEESPRRTNDATDENGTEARPSDEIEERQDPGHTRQDFLRDLDQATQRTEQP